MIRFIQPEETYFLRTQILRNADPSKNVQFPDDFKSGSFHLGKFIEGELVGIISFAQAQAPIAKKDLISYQLRGMAVALPHQKKGIGEELCTKAHEIIQLFGAEQVWCNARVSALGFYEKLGYRTIGEEFPIEDAGGHFVMIKTLS